METEENTLHHSFSKDILWEWDELLPPICCNKNSCLFPPPMANMLLQQNQNNSEKEQIYKSLILWHLPRQSCLNVHNVPQCGQAWLWPMPTSYMTPLPSPQSWSSDTCTAFWCRCEEEGLSPLFQQNTRGELRCRRRANGFVRWGEEQARKEVPWDWAKWK